MNRQNFRISPLAMPLFAVLLHGIAATVPAIAQMSRAAEPGSVAAGRLRDRSWTPGNTAGTVLAIDPRRSGMVYTTLGHGELARESFDGSVGHGLTPPSMVSRVIRVVPHPFDSNVLMVENDDGQVRMSRDAGVTWQPILDVAALGWTPGEFAIRFDEVNPSLIVAAGASVIASPDLGLTWHRWSGALHSRATELQISIIRPQRIVLGHEDGAVSRAYLKADAGETLEWSRSTPRTGKVSAILLDPLRPDYMAVGYREKRGEAGNLFQTDGDGAMWQAWGHEGLPDAQINGLAWAADRAAVVSTGDSLFVREEGGAAWMRENVSTGRAYSASVLAHARDGVLLKTSAAVASFTYAATTAVCNYDTRFRLWSPSQGLGYVWDNYVDYGPSALNFNGRLVGSKSNAYSCQPNSIKSTSSLDPFLHFTISRTGDNPLDFSVQFAVKRYDGTDYRQRALYLEKPRSGYPGTVLTVTQLGSKVASCSATPLTLGLRAPAASNFNPATQRIITVFFDYQNPNCPMSRTGQVVACGLGGASGGDKTRVYVTKGGIITCAADVDLGN